MSEKLSWFYRIYVLTALAAFLGLAIISNTTPYFNLDLLFSREIQSSPPAWISFTLRWVSWPGYLVPSIILSLLVAFVLAVLGERWAAVSALFGSGLSGIVNYLVKIIIRRPRPSSNLVEVFQSLDSYSFPSGHVMFYITLFGFLIFLAMIFHRRSLKRNLLLIFPGAMVLLIGVSRIYLGEHWASDVIGGYILGSLTLLLTIKFYRWKTERFS